MWRLLRAESHRFRLRMFFRFVAVAALVVVGLLLASTAKSAGPPTDAQVTEASTWFEQSHSDWSQYVDSGQMEQDLEDCKEMEAQEQQNDPTADWGCTADNYGWPEPVIEDYLPGRGSFPGEAAGVTASVGYLMIAIAFAMGVSFLTAEISTGAIGNWLSFAPRRHRVLASKAVVVALGTGALAALALGIVVLGQRLIYGFYDRMGTAAEASAAMTDVLQTSGRALVAVAMLALVGLALGTIFRHAALAVGILIGYLVVVEAALRAFITKIEPWSIYNAMRAWVEGGASYYEEECVRNPTEGYMECNYIEHTFSQARGGWMLLALTAALLLTAFVVFRRRDVA